MRRRAPVRAHAHPLPTSRISALQILLACTFLPGPSGKGTGTGRAFNAGTGLIHTAVHRFPAPPLSRHPQLATFAAWDLGIGGRLRRGAPPLTGRGTHRQTFARSEGTTILPCADA